jgi:hypothetical protein
MEITLVVITLVSLALASAMSLVTWRMVVLDRRREAAQVAALVDLAREDDDLALSEVPQPAPGRSGVPDADPIFATPERESPTGRRFIAIGAVAVVMAVGVGTLMFMAIEPDAGSSATAAARPAVDRAAVGTAGAPLELMSLRHDRNGEKLTITGLVVNPRHGQRVERASAVVFVFDPAGTFVASGRALIDFTKLDPGDESPFVVTVDAPGRIGRYRVGFRGQDGAVVGHVDRRAGV